MLYDPKREVETKRQDDLLTLRSLIAWLEKKNPAGEYDYIDPFDCLLCRYFKDAGFKEVHVGPWAWSAVGVIERRLPPYFNEVANGTYDTYGAALHRARALLSTDK